MSGQSGAAAGLTVEEGGVAETLSMLYQRKVAQGRQQINDAGQGQLALLKALKTAIDDVNDNDPFLSIKVVKPQNSASYLVLSVQEDGQNAVVLNMRLNPKDNDSSHGCLAFYRSDDKEQEPVFTVSETALDTGEGVSRTFKEGLADVLASQVLEKAPKNLSLGKRDAIFELG